MEQTLKKLISTLGKIEVKGKDNLDMLLGCIQTLERLLEICVEAKQEQKEEETGA